MGGGTRREVNHEQERIYVSGGSECGCGAGSVGLEGVRWYVWVVANIFCLMGGIRQLIFFHIIA